MINQLISIISVVLNQVIKPNSVAGDNIETVENYTPVYIRCPSSSLHNAYIEQLKFLAVVCA